MQQPHATAPKPPEDIWIFAYGSLVWRPEFPYSERHPAYIDGWTRRFWQGSPDHRGTPQALGRVVTLVRDPAARCWGMAYRVAGASRTTALDVLDHRERGGYERVEVAMFTPGVPAGIAGTTYIATADNPHYLGPAAVEVMVAQIMAGRGQSGSNVDYVVRLAASLVDMGADDPHVAELARLLLQESEHG